LDCLELAVECNCKSFLSIPIVQSNLNNIWRGSIRETVDLVWIKKYLYASLIFYDCIIFCLRPKEKKNLLSVKKNVIIMKNTCKLLSKPRQKLIN